MALIDHFARDAGTNGDGGNGFKRFPSHEFSRMLLAAIAGRFGNAEKRRQKLIDAFDLQDDDLPHLDAILSQYGRKTNLIQITRFFVDTETSFLLYESGYITRDEALENMGLAKENITRPPNRQQ